MYHGFKTYVKVKYRTRAQKRKRKNWEDTNMRFLFAHEVLQYLKVGCD